MALPSGLRVQKDSWFSQPHFLPTQVRKPRACGSSCGQSIRNVPGTGSDLSSGTLPTTPWPPRPPATAEAVCARTLKVLSSPAPQAGRAPHLRRPVGLPGEAVSPSLTTPSFHTPGPLPHPNPSFSLPLAVAYRGLAHSPLLLRALQAWPHARFP